MWVCTCGFANSDTASPCMACGSARPEDRRGGHGTAHASPAPSPSAAENPGTTALLLEDLRSATVVEVPAPGGIVGRAGDFSPHAFSPRVSGQHLAVRPGPDGDRWKLAFVGRNATALCSGGSWVPLAPGVVYPVFGGELVKMADMLFRVEVRRAGATAGEACDSGRAAGATPDEARASWSVRCPACGTEHPVAGPDERVGSCTFCSDPLDRVKIAQVAPRAVAGGTNR